MPNEIHDCFECGVPITECTCADSHTYEVENGPACPHCGLLNLASDSDGGLYREGSRSWDCDHCGKVFTVQISVSHVWEAKR